MKPIAAFFNCQLGGWDGYDAAADARAEGAFGRAIDR